jgi:hypothetical protein
MRRFQMELGNFMPGKNTCRAHRDEQPLPLSREPLQVCRARLVVYCTLEQIQCDMPEHREVLGGVPLANTAVVFAKGEVEDSDG